MWNEIVTAEDIERLMEQYAGFHDSCIVSVNYTSGVRVDENNAMIFSGLMQHTVNMVLHSQQCGPIELKFVGVRKCNIVGWEDNFSCEIGDAHIGFHTDLLGRARDDRLVVWADNYCFNPVQYVEEKVICLNGFNCTYVVAEELFWRMPA